MLRMLATQCRWSISYLKTYSMPIQLHVEDWMKHLIIDIQTSNVTAFI